MKHPRLILAAVLTSAAVLLASCVGSVSTKPKPAGGGPDLTATQQVITTVLGIGADVASAQDPLTVTLTAPLTVTVANPKTASEPFVGDPNRDEDGPALTVLGVNIAPNTDPADRWDDQCQLNRYQPGSPVGAVLWTCNLPDLPPGFQRPVTFIPKDAAKAASITDAAAHGYHPSKPTRWVTVFMASAPSSTAPPPATPTTP